MPFLALLFVELATPFNLLLSPSSESSELELSSEDAAFSFWCFGVPFMFLTLEVSSSSSELELSSEDAAFLFWCFGVPFMFLTFEVSSSSSELELSSEDEAFPFCYCGRRTSRCWT